MRMLANTMFILLLTCFFAGCTNTTTTPAQPVTNASAATENMSYMYRSPPPGAISAMHLAR